MNRYFDELGSQIWIVWVAKSDLKKTINEDPSYLTDFEGAPLPEILEDAKFGIERIERLEEEN